jgi:hypothetical protein
MMPIAAVTAVVRNRNDYDEVIAQSIDDRVREV